MKKTYQMTNKSSWDKFAFVCTVCLISSFFIFDMTALSSISILICDGILFTLILMKKGTRLKVSINRFHKATLLFVAFCFFSAIWALNPYKAIANGITILEILVSISIIGMYYQDSYNTNTILKCIFWSGIVISVYTITFYGFETFKYMLLNSERVGNDYANANAIGMWMAITVTVGVWLIAFYGFRLKYCAIALPFFIVALAQSRTALIEAIIGVLLILFLRYRNQKNVLRTIGKMILIIIGIIGILILLSKLAIFDGILMRMEQLIQMFTGGSDADSSSLVRSAYIKLGFEQFLRTPLFGIGMGSTYILTGQYSTHSTYLHNNFVEVLASGGIIGFVCYYSMHAYIIKELFKKLKSNNPETIICFVLIVIHTLADYGTVCYYKKYNYLILFVCFFQIYFSKREIQRERLIIR